MIVENNLITGPVTWFDRDGAMYIECLGMNKLAEPISIQIYNRFKFRFFLLSQLPYQGERN